MKNMLFIINSASGKIALADTLMNVCEIFSNADYDMKIHLTKGEGDIENLIKDEAQITISSFAAAETELSISLRELPSRRALISVSAISPAVQQTILRHLIRSIP